MEYNMYYVTALLTLEFVCCERSHWKGKYVLRTRVQFSSRAVNGALLYRDDARCSGEMQRTASGVNKPAISHCIHRVTVA